MELPALHARGAAPREEVSAGGAHGGVLATDAGAPATIGAQDIIAGVAKDYIDKVQ